MTGPSVPQHLLSGLREARLALLARSRGAIVAFGLLATFMLTAGTLNDRTWPIVLLGFVVLLALQAGFYQQARQAPVSPRATAVCGAAIGVSWCALMLLLLPGLGHEQRLALVVASSALIASFVLTASVLSVALALALPVVRHSP